MTDSSLHYLPATELVKRIRDKSLSPVELMKATIARAEELNPRLNAIGFPIHDLRFTGSEISMRFASGSRT